MVIKKEEFLTLIKESVFKQERKKVLEKKIKKLQEKIDYIDRNSVMLNEDGTSSQANTSSYNPQASYGTNNSGSNIYTQPNVSTTQPNTALTQNIKPTKEEKEENIFDAKPGETIVFNFEGVTIKLQRQIDDVFKVVDATESKQLKKDDYIKIEGNPILQKGRDFEFQIYRLAGVKYKSRPLSSWFVIKNR